MPFILSIFGVVVYDVYNYKNVSKNYLWVLIFIYTSLLIGLRYYVGGDTFYYHEFFRRLVDYSLFDFESAEGYQPFFLIFLKIAKFIYSDFVIFQILHILFINIILFWFIKNNTKYIFSAFFFIFHPFF